MYKLPQQHKEERVMQIQALRIVRDAKIIQQREIGDPTAAPPQTPTPEARPPPQAPTPRITTPEPSPELMPPLTVLNAPPPSTAPPTLGREQRKRARAQSVILVTTPCALPLIHRFVGCPNLTDERYGVPKVIICAAIRSYLVRFFLGES
jgi:hypothetical protein